MVAGAERGPSGRCLLFYFAAVLTFVRLENDELMFSK